MMLTLQDKTKLARFLASVVAKRWLLPNLDVMPVVAELFLTENCNLRCVSCACWRSNTEGELTTREWFAVIEQLGELGFVKLNFTGGEALIRSDAVEIILFAASKTNAKLHLNTNAILLTPSKSQELINAGIRSFNISLDGASPDVHDRIRGQKGAFALTVDHLRELVKFRKEFDLRLRICFTIMRQNVGQLVDIARLAQELKVSLFFNVVTDHTFLFRGYNIARLGQFQDNALNQALDEFLSFKRRYPQFLPRYSVICYIGDHFEDQLQKKLPCVESNLKLMVHSEGQVGGCWAHDPHFSIRSQSVREIIRSPEFRNKQSDLFFKRCKGCGANHSLNLRLEPRALAYDALWRLGVLTKRRKIYA